MNNICDSKKLGLILKVENLCVCSASRRGVNGLIVFQHISWITKRTHFANELWARSSAIEYRLYEAFDSITKHLNGHILEGVYF